MKPEYVDVKTARRHRREMLSDRRIYQLVAAGVLKPPVIARLGRRIFVNLRELDRFLEEGGSAFPGGGWRRGPGGGDAGPNTDQQKLPFPQP